MKLSASNIGWTAEQDEEMYGFLRDSGFSGLEIAPTRIFPERPYEQIENAGSYAAELRRKYGLSVPSMQSILYGVTANIFGGDADYASLTEYLKKAVDFAAAIDCGNLVFGCPKNRNYSDINQIGIAVDFFAEIGEYALKKGTVISIEPNPKIYGTNFLNTTREAVEFIKSVGSGGIKLNVDFGTIVENGESVNYVAENAVLVNHIHISEPMLAPIERREDHKILLDEMRRAGYEGYVSIEMKNTGNLDAVKSAAAYLREICDEDL